MNVLNDWIHARRQTLTWLDCDRYMWSVFAGAPERWYEEPAVLVATAAQALPLLGSDVHAISVLGSFSRLLVPGQTPDEACSVLAEPEPRRVLAETVDALLHKLGDRIAVVLDCPSPRKLLGAAPDLSFDDLDDAAAALVDVIRSVADRPIAGFQITCDTTDGPDVDELDAWSSMLAAAEHYGWASVLRLDGVTKVTPQIDGLPAKLLLFPRVPAAQLEDDQRHGGGLTPAVWADSDDAAALMDGAAERRFRFGEIPFDASPETVLARVAALR